MTNLSTNDKLVVQAQEDSDYAIDEKTELAYVTQPGLAKVLDIPRSSLFIYLEKAAQNILDNGSTTSFQKVDSGRHIVKAFGSNEYTNAKLFSAEDIYYHAIVINPEVAKEMRTAGCNTYILHKAREKANLVAPTLEQQHQEHIARAKKLLEHLQTETTDEAEEYFSIWAYLVDENLTEFFDKKQLYALNRRIAMTFRINRQLNPKRMRCVLTGRKANHYQVSDLFMVEQALDISDI